MNGSKRVGDEIYFELQALIEFDFSKASGLYYKWQWKNSVIESLKELAFSFRLWQVLFLVKLQAYIMNSCFGRLVKLIIILLRNEKKPSRLIEISMRFPWWKTYRSSHPEVFLEKGVPKICSKFTGEHPCRSVISIKLLTTLLKSHFGMCVLLWICCMFSEHLFLGTPVGGCFWIYRVDSDKPIKFKPKK